MTWRVLKYFIPVLMLSGTTGFSVIAQWKPAGSPVSSPWGEQVTSRNAWQEYPRPQLVRQQWYNLNGLWDYTIIAKDSNQPAHFDGKILVPYAVESSLSGVGKPLLPTQELWYRRTFTVPASWKNQRIRLHFGAVDYKAVVYINKQLVGEHTGSSDPFSFDITDHLRKGVQEVLVKVWDPTDTDIQPRGKQALHPTGFWYTAVSGIWQTVWLEPVSPTSIRFFNPVPDIDKEAIEWHAVADQLAGDEKLAIRVSYKGEQVSFTEVPFSTRVVIPMRQAKLWSPVTPHIYDVEVTLKRNGRVLDHFSSYFAMRKISLGQDKNNHTRLFLNNEPLFQWGVLDQGWWPESLLTPPTDEALKYDMQVIKDLGFNMIRKHIKVEPARFYFHADTMGLLVWQDMPSGFLKIHHPEQHVKHDAEADWNRPLQSAREFEAEWKSIMDHLRFFPSIVVWVPFNEGWGQYDTERITAWTEQYDPHRLVNATSGWTDRKVGTMYDAHQYPGPAMEPPAQHPGRAVVLGEFGGLGWPVHGHLWDAGKRNWGYRNYRDKETFLTEYATVIRNVYPLISRGLAAAVYTQTSDVEGEVNGLLTYDRKVLKIPYEQAVPLHQKLYSEYAPPRVLVPDAEEGPSVLHVSKEYPGDGWYDHNPFPKAFSKRAGPYRVKKGGSVWAINSFVKEDNGYGPAMKLYAQGDLKIYLNGHLVYDKRISSKRHYDEFNLAPFASILRANEKNIIALELTNATDDADFDFGVYEFKENEK